MGDHFRLTFHALMVAWYIVVDIRLILIGVTVLLSRWDILWNQFGWGLQYLTLWNLVIQQVYFMLSLKEDLLSKQDKSKQNLSNFLNYFYCSIVFPMTFVVSLDFWIVYKWDAKLVDNFDAVNTLLPYINHSLHTTIVPIIIAETYISQKSLKNIRLSEVYNNLIFLHFIYGCVVYLFNFLGNVWPYPFFGILSINGHFILSNINAAVGVLFVCIAQNVKSINVYKNVFSYCNIAKIKKKESKSMGYDFKM